MESGSVIRAALKRPIKHRMGFASAVFTQDRRASCRTTDITTITDIIHQFTDLITITTGVIMVMGISIGITRN